MLWRPEVRTGGPCRSHWKPRRRQQRRLSSSGGGVRSVAVSEAAASMVVVGGECWRFLGRSRCGSRAAGVRQRARGSGALWRLRASCFVARMPCNRPALPLGASRQALDAGSSWGTVWAAGVFSPAAAESGRTGRVMTEDGRRGAGGGRWAVGVGAVMPGAVPVGGSGSRAKHAPEPRWNRTQTKCSTVSGRGTMRPPSSTFGGG